ncbi:WD40/YVTN/BNR-like repeat-containing protein [Motilibacter deserti]|uniref:Exo-alpha-sialidase n=1 Tax=Motilibacter deserti TaxID=2714956 RepID=A0ABX0GNM8_9ACTN|nr:exo-alpha-sialidase [Motilibacter deserti]
MPALVAIATRKGLWLASDTGSGWELSDRLLGMNAVYSVAIDTRGAVPRLLAGVDSEHWGPSVMTSDDLGRTWQEPEDAPVRFPERTGTSLTRVWQLQPAPASQPDVVWAGTQPSALFRSEDGGRSFSFVDGLWDHPHRPEWGEGYGGQAVHTILPHPVEPDRVLVAMSTGGVYRSADRGKSWTAANRGISAAFLPEPEPEFGQCVHKVAFSPGRPEQLFAQNHGGVFRSDDEGTTWAPIDDGLPASFGFPVVAHPHRPGTAYVFPLVADMDRRPADGRCRVFRTDDAGATWRSTSAGLPDEPHFGGVVLRDAMSTDGGVPAGVYFGNRNGEVYASRDEGESWSVVARHLPDVLCVRAAVLA